MKPIRILVSILIFSSIVGAAPAEKLCQLYSGSIRSIYPVGAIYISTNNTNPAELFGFGTWERFGNGRVLVGVNESETEFDTVQETGGEKTHTLTIAEMPSHTHTQKSHTHNIVSRGYSSSSDGGISRFSGSSGYDTNNTSGSTIAVNENTGGGQPHNNLQPYITVYIWRRAS